MENGINRLTVGRVELGHYVKGCPCGACEADTMSRKAMKSIALIVILIVAAAVAYKNWAWISSRINRGQIL